VNISSNTAASLVFASANQQQKSLVNRSAEIRWSLVTRSIDPVYNNKLHRSRSETIGSQIILGYFGV